MMRMELRDDGWFEAGKDVKDTFPIGYLIYQSKKELKEHLEKIGEQKSIGELEKKLKEIPELFQFRRTPYLVGDKVMIDTPGLPGQCYLGKVVNKE
ncbi:hypothetical protein JW756_03540 [Candidatus Woesearchaeota archaeon]|nr:hypothetical protein [Candidatus Woesearchaeota archaeon]